MTRDLEAENAKLRAALEQQRTTMLAEMDKLHAEMDRVKSEFLFAALSPPPKPPEAARETVEVRDVWRLLWDTRAALKSGEPREEVEQTLSDAMGSLERLPPVNETCPRCAEYREALRNLYKQVEDHRFAPDHACAECVGPRGEIVVPGFRCGRHGAAAALSNGGGK